MRSYGGHIPGNRLNGEDQYVEFYKVEEIDREIRRLEWSIEADQWKRAREALEKLKGLQI